MIDHDLVGRIIDPIGSNVMLEPGRFNGTRLRQFNLRVIVRRDRDGTVLNGYGRAAVGNVTGFGPAIQVKEFVFYFP